MDAEPVPAALVAVDEGAVAEVAVDDEAEPLELQAAVTTASATAPAMAAVAGTDRNPVNLTEIIQPPPSQF